MQASLGAHVRFTYEIGIERAHSSGSVYARPVLIYASPTQAIMMADERKSPPCGCKRDIYIHVFTCHVLCVLACPPRPTAPRARFPSVCGDWKTWVILSFSYPLLLTFYNLELQYWVTN